MSYSSQCWAVKSKLKYMSDILPTPEAVGASQFVSRITLATFPNGFLEYGASNDACNYSYYIEAFTEAADRVKSTLRSAMP